MHKVFPEAVDWRTAKRKCEEERGHLCTITSKEEYDGIISNLPQGERGHHYWIGATDEKQEGHWEWVTGEKFDFSMWSPGQPDNHSTIEHYLELWFEPDRWGWNDAKPHKFYYICEWE